MFLRLTATVYHGDCEYCGFYTDRSITLERDDETLASLNEDNHLGSEDSDNFSDHLAILAKMLTPLGLTWSLGPLISLPPSEDDGDVLGGDLIIFRDGLEVARIPMRGESANTLALVEPSYGEIEDMLAAALRAIGYVVTLDKTEYEDDDNAWDD
jgi:hypothetical protein